MYTKVDLPQSWICIFESGKYSLAGNLGQMAGNDVCLQSGNHPEKEIGDERGHKCIKWRNSCIFEFNLFNISDEMSFHFWVRILRQKMNEFLAVTLKPVNGQTTLDFPWMQIIKKGKRTFYQKSCLE